MSKKHFFSPAVFTAVAICNFFTAAAANFQPLGQPIMLEAGTRVTVELNEEVDALTVQPGNPIKCKVIGDVRVNGKTLIKNGAYAEATIEQVEPGCNGKCSKLVITVRAARAVDGQMVSLDGTPFIAKAPCCDGSTMTVIIGKRIAATVQDDTLIKP